MANPGAPIVIDGSHGEGGGALLRTALCMGALTQQPLRVTNVRGGTVYHGLDIEDLLLIQALAQSCSAELVGIEPGSTAISFLPTARPKSLNGPIQLDGEKPRRNANALVVLCSLMPVLARSGAYSQITAAGETYGANALTFDYFANVTLPALRRMGLYAFADQRLAAFGRESAGEVTLDIEPSVLEGVQWSERGKMRACHAIVATSDLPPGVGSRGLSHLELLSQNSGVPVSVEQVRVKAHTPGAFVTVWAEFERGFGGATAMGSRGLKIESLVQSAFESLLQWLASDATVDPFLADHLLLPAVLAETPTTFKTSRLTQRFLTSVWVVKQFLPIHITVRGSENTPGTVTIKR